MLTGFLDLALKVYMDARLSYGLANVIQGLQAEQAWSLLAATPLRAALFPHSNPSDPLIGLAMRNTDLRIQADKPVTPAFLIAVLLWEDYRARAQDLAEQWKPAEARLHAASDCLAEQQQIIAIPRRFSLFVREVWQLQFLHL